MMGPLDVVRDQEPGLLKGDVYSLPGGPALTVSAADTQGAGQDRHGVEISGTMYTMYTYKMSPKIRLSQVVLDKIV